jgi:hypothetical protein
MQSETMLQNRPRFNAKKECVSERETDSYFLHNPVFDFARVFSSHGNCPYWKSLECFVEGEPYKFTTASSSFYLILRLAGSHPKLSFRTSFQKLGHLALLVGTQN